MRALISPRAPVSLSTPARACAHCTRRRSRPLGAQRVAIALQEALLAPPLAEAPAGRGAAQQHGTLRRQELRHELRRRRCCLQHRHATTRRACVSPRCSRQCVSDGVATVGNTEQTTKSAVEVRNAAPALASALKRPELGRQPPVFAAWANPATWAQRITVFRPRKCKILSHNNGMRTVHVTLCFVLQWESHTPL